MHKQDARRNRKDQTRVRQSQARTTLGRACVSAGIRVQGGLESKDLELQSSISSVYWIQCGLLQIIFTGAPF